MPRYEQKYCTVCLRAFSTRNKAKHCSNECSKTTVTIKKQTERRRLEVEFETINPAPIGCRWIAVTSGKKRFVYSLIDEGAFSRLTEHLWGLSTQGYAFLRRNGESINLHKLVLDCPLEFEVDHINRNRLDNRLDNLRLATHAQNSANTEMRENNTSGYRGVNFFQNRWVARIAVENSRLYLGRFHTAEEAAEAYDDAARRFHGEFAQLNFPPGEN